MASATTKGSYPYPESTDIADVPKDIKALADRLEAVLHGASGTGPWTQELNAKIPGQILIIPSTTAPPNTAPEGTVLFIYEA